MAETKNQKDKPQRKTPSQIDANFVPAARVAVVLEVVPVRIDTWSVPSWEKTLGMSDAIDMTAAPVKEVGPTAMNIPALWAGRPNAISLLK